MGNRLNFASKSSKGKILRAVKNFNGPFIIPRLAPTPFQFIQRLRFSAAISSLYHGVGGCEVTKRVFNGACASTEPCSIFYHIDHINHSHYMQVRRKVLVGKPRYRCEIQLDQRHKFSDSVFYRKTKNPLEPKISVKDF